MAISVPSFTQSVMSHIIHAPRGRQFNATGDYCLYIYLKLAKLHLGPITLTAFTSSTVDFQSFDTSYQPCCLKISAYISCDSSLFQCSTYRLLIWKWRLVINLMYTDKGDTKTEQDAISLSDQSKIFNELSPGSPFCPSLDQEPPSSSS